MGLIKSKFFPFLKNSKKALGLFLSFFKFKKKSDFDGKHTELDKKVVYSLSKTKIPTFRQIKYASKFLTKKEVWLIRVLILVIIANLAFLGFRFYKDHLQEVPISGGDYIEALVGSPKHINPIYSSINDVDNDITSLVFSSLFKYDNHGELVKDLVSDYAISENGKEYTLTIRGNAKWHDGSDLNINDIVFTFNTIKNQAYESPLRSSFVGVNIEKVSDDKLKFTLSEKYSPFLNLLTFGIIPKKLWSMIAVEAASLAEINLKPIGSGPYKFKSLIKDKLGSIKAYNLEANPDYYGDKPNIKNLTFKFFVNFTEAINALNNNSVDGLSYLPYVNKDDLVAKDALGMHGLDLPQIDSVFFNRDTKNPVLKDLNVRKALAYATSKDQIISEVLSGDGKKAYGPILESSFAFHETEEKYDFDINKARKLLEENGWEEFNISEEEIEVLKDMKESSMSVEASSTAEESDDEGEDNEEEKEGLKPEEEIKLSLGAGTWRVKEKDEEKNYLAINLTTLNEDRNIRVAEKLKELWEQIGVKVNLVFVPISQIQSEVIEPRNFEALFFSQFVGSDPDSYAFWHSTQIDKGGLNLSNYANDKVDEMLEEARVSLNNEDRASKYQEFQELISKDVPAIFLYSPLYIYVQSKKIKGFEGTSLIQPSGRFSNISSWYMKTGKKLIW